MTAGLVWTLALALSDVDRSIYEDIRYGWRDPGLGFAASLVSGAGGPLAQLGIEGVMYLRGRPTQQRAARLAGVAWTAAFAATVGTKALVRRARPERDNSTWWDSSFPSGHAACYYAATTIYGRKWPELAPFTALGGLLMCLSRVHLGRHYPSDVIAGAVLGYGCAAGTLALERRLTPVLDRIMPLRGAALDVGPDRLGFVCGI